MSLRPDSTLGCMEVFVSADRYYQAGFRIKIGADLVMALKPGDKQLSIVRSDGESDRLQAQCIRWDADKLRLLIGKWTASAPKLAIKIVPMPGAGPAPDASR